MEKSVKKGKGYFEFKNDMAMAIGAFLLYGALAIILWKNFKTFGDVADQQNSNALSRRLSNLSTWNAINFLVIFAITLFWLANLVGFIGYSAKVWRRHPRWVKSASSYLQEINEQQPRHLAKWSPNENLLMREIPLTLIRC
jgi:hypothetical protein